MFGPDTETLPQRLSFSTAHIALQTAWDSTSLGALKTCPRYYQLSILLGYVPHAESVHLRFGIEFHSALETYDIARACGSDHEAALKIAVRQALINTWNEALGRPWSSDEPTKTRETLIRSIIWYLDQFENDPAQTLILADGRPAVELSFRFETGYKSKLTGEEFLMCGHLDRGARFQDRTWIIDRKTTKMQLSTDYFAKYSPDNQVSLYSVAGQIVFNEPVAGLIIDAGQVAVTFSRFQRQPIGRTKSQLEEWFENITGFWFPVVEYLAEKYGDKPWPQNDKACGMYGGCPYRGICGVSPEVRQRLLDTMFTRREWDPLKIRGVPTP